MFKKISDIKSSRRSLVAALGVTVSQGAFNSVLGSNQTKNQLDFSLKKDQLTALIKMRASMNNEAVMGGVKGFYYGVVNGKIRPLFGVLAGSFAKYNQIDEFSYQAISFEVAYFTDWNTGALLKTFDNPYTGEVVKVPQTRMGPSSSLVISLEEQTIESENPALSGLDIHHRFLPPRNENGTVVLVEEIRVGTPDDFPGSPFHYNEVDTYRASMSELVDPNIAVANVSTHFNSILSWRPWLKMDGYPGHMFGTATGGRYNTIDDFPSYYVELTNQYHPDVFSDIEALLDGNEG